MLIYLPTNYLNYPELYIRISTSNSPNSSCKSKNELFVPTPSNFRIRVNAELRIANSNANHLNYESGNYDIGHHYEFEGILYILNCPLKYHLCIFTEKKYHLFKVQNELFKHEFLKCCLVK